MLQHRRSNSSQGCLSAGAGWDSGRSTACCSAWSAPCAEQSERRGKQLSSGMNNGGSRLYDGSRRLPVDATGNALHHAVFEVPRVLQTRHDVFQPTYALLERLGPELDGVGVCFPVRSGRAFAHETMIDRHCVRLRIIEKGVPPGPPLVCTQETLLSVFASRITTFAREDQTDDFGATVARTPAWSLRADDPC